MQRTCIGPRESGGKERWGATEKCRFATARPTLQKSQIFQYLGALRESGGYGRRAGLRIQCRMPQGVGVQVPPLALPLPIRLPPEFAWPTRKGTPSFSCRHDPLSVIAQRRNRVVCPELAGFDGASPDFICAIL